MQIFKLMQTISYKADVASSLRRHFYSSRWRRRPLEVAKEERVKNCGRNSVRFYCSFFQREIEYAKIEEAAPMISSREKRELGWVSFLRMGRKSECYRIATILRWESPLPSIPAIYAILCDLRSNAM